LLLVLLQSVLGFAAPLKRACGMTSGDTVTIIGVGLIGGSIGLGLRQRAATQRVIGVGRSPKTLQQAIDLGAIDEAMDLPAAAAVSDCVVVCTPVDSVAQFACAALKASPQIVVTDAGSTKATILEQVAQSAGSAAARFVGSHPMAGKEKGGVQEALADLFVDRTVVLTPVADTSPEATQRVTSLWETLGANIKTMSPGDHDAAVSAVSHLPHLAASALAANAPSAALALAAGGFDDTTRIADINLKVWPAICLHNKVSLLADLDRYGERLAALRTAIQNDDANALTALFQAGIDQLQLRKQQQEKST